MPKNIDNIKVDIYSMLGFLELVSRDAIVLVGLSITLGTF